mgnify:CR=1 FL=1
MARIRVAFALLFCVFVTLGAPAVAEPLAQDAWASLKKEVRLSNGLKLAYVEAGADKSATGSYVISYRWEGGGLLGGRSLRFNGFTRG